MQIMTEFEALKFVVNQSRLVGGIDVCLSVAIVIDVMAWIELIVELINLLNLVLGSQLEVWKNLNVLVC